MTKNYSKLTLEPQPAPNLDLKRLSPEERNLVTSIDVPQHVQNRLPTKTTVTAVYYLDGQESEAVKTFIDCNWVTLRESSDQTLNMIRQELSPSQRNRFRYYRAFHQLHPSALQATTGIPQTYLREMTTSNGAHWIFDSDGYEQWHATDSRVIDAGARIPPDRCIESLTPPPNDHFGPTDVWAADIIGDIDVIYRYCLARWEPQYTRTVKNTTDVLSWNRRTR